LGSTGGEAFRSILLRPQGLLLHFFSLRNLGNLILLFLPLGFLALLEPAMLAIAGPLLLGLLSSNCFFYNNHHTGTVIPVIFAAAIGAAGALISKFKIKFRNIAAGLAVFILINSMLCAVFYGPSPLSWRFWQRSSYRYWNTLHQFRVSAHDRIADRIMKMVPAQASLSVSNHLGAHLSNREVIYQFPHPQDLNQVDFIAVDILEYTPLIWLPRQQELKALNRVFKEGNFVLSFSEDGILLFARKQAGKQDEFRMGIEKIQSGIPAHEVNLPLGNRLLLLGFDLEKDYFFCGGKQRIVYYWQVLEGVRKKFRYAYFGLQDDLSGQYVLIDTLKQGKTQAHLVHLPLYLVLAAGDLKAGDILREEFDFYLPPDLNNGWYDWQTGLYVAPEFYSIRTQNEGLVPGTAEIDLGKIELKSKGR
jgi:hypothetical protein